MSLIEKLETVDKKEFKDQGVQTEKQKRAYTLRKSQDTGVDVSKHFFILSVIMKLTKVQQMLANTVK